MRTADTETLMSDSKKGASPVNKDMIRELADLLKETELNEIVLTGQTQFGPNYYNADLSEAEVRALIAESVEGFREAMAKTAAELPEVPF